MPSCAAWGELNVLEIVSKCVIASCNEISQMHVVTALVNNFETDQICLAVHFFSP